MANLVLTISMRHGCHNMLFLSRHNFCTNFYDNWGNHGIYPRLKLNDVIHISNGIHLHGRFRKFKMFLHPDKNTWISTNKILLILLLMAHIWVIYLSFHSKNMPLFILWCHFNFPHSRSILWSLNVNWLIHEMSRSGEDWSK